MKIEVSEIGAGLFYQTGLVFHVARGVHEINCEKMEYELGELSPVDASTLIRLGRAKRLEA